MAAGEASVEGSVKVHLRSVTKCFWVKGRRIDALAGIDLDKWWFGLRAEVFHTDTTNSFGPAPVSSGNWDAALQNYATTNNIKSWWTGNTQPDRKVLTVAQLGRIFCRRDSQID